MNQKHGPFIQMTNQPMNRSMEPAAINGCRECAQSTTGRCNAHPSTVLIAGTYSVQFISAPDANTLCDRCEYPFWNHEANGICPVYCTFRPKRSL